MSVGRLGRALLPLLLGALVGCGGGTSVEPTETTGAVTEAGGLPVLVGFAVDGMTTPEDLNQVRAAVEDLGVTWVSDSLENSTITVEPGDVSNEDIKAAIQGIEGAEYVATLTPPTEFSPLEDTDGEATGESGMGL